MEPHPGGQVETHVAVVDTVKPPEPGQAVGGDVLHPHGRVERDHRKACFQPGRPGQEVEQAKPPFRRPDRHADGRERRGQARQGGVDQHEPEVRGPP